jgi:hypothetical protein
MKRTGTKHSTVEQLTTLLLVRTNKQQNKIRRHWQQTQSVSANVSVAKKRLSQFCQKTETRNTLSLAARPKPVAAA